jgi:hypothetical protein
VAGLSTNARPRWFEFGKCCRAIFWQKQFCDFATFEAVVGQVTSRGRPAYEAFGLKRNVQCKHCIKTGLYFGTKPAAFSPVAGICSRRNGHDWLMGCPRSTIARQPLLNATVAGVLSVATSSFMSGYAVGFCGKHHLKFDLKGLYYAS